MSSEALPFFAIVPGEVIKDRRLTLEQLRVLIALFSFRGKDTNTVYPRREAIAERTGMHPANISSATSALERLGWLRKDGKGGYSKATRYTISVPDTVADQATVAESATVAEQATGTVAESATRSLAESATRKEHKKEHNQVNRKSSQSVNPGFDLFYSAYPKKKARHDALHAWTKLNPDERLQSTILLAVEAAKHSPEWLKSGGEFIPLPATWIRGRRWEDEVNAAPKTYAASELEVIERYNAVLSEAGWPVAVAYPYRDERAEAVREFLTFGSKENWIEMYFAWLRDNLEPREGFGFDWVVSSATYLRAREGNFAALREAA